MGRFLWSAGSGILLDDFKNFVILKKGIGIESQKTICKQANNQKTIQTRWNSIVIMEQNVDSKAFAIPILTAILIKSFRFYL